MFLFTRKRRKLADERKETQIQAVRADTNRSLDKANSSLKKLNEELDDEGLAKLIYLAVGADRHERS